jgi:hypothetical protein
VLSYVLPLCAAEPRPDLTPYLQWLSARADVIVVDGSPPDVFAVHAGWWQPFVRHLPVDPACRTPMGKVGGVLTGVVRAHEDKVVIADDDVRYDDASLARLERLLDEAEVVRPQNVFTAWPWHAWWDTGRTLIARATGGDWPGTLGVRRDVLLDAGGYAGDVMFENLELVRTVRAAGGREHVALDVVVGRIPPSGGHFRSQRVRQAYDELARPARLAVQLALLPVVAVGRLRAVAAIVVISLAAAEIGRRRGGGRRHYPAWTTLAAPVWVAERAVTCWLAVACRTTRGGVRYGDVALRRAASSSRALRVRQSSRRELSTQNSLPSGSASTTHDPYPVPGDAKRHVGSRAGRHVPSRRV